MYMYTHVYVYVRLYTYVYVTGAHNLQLEELREELSMLNMKTKETQRSLQLTTSHLM